MPAFPVKRDAASAEFFTAAASGVFLLVKDAQDGHVHGPEFDRSVDPDRYVAVPAAGTGHVVSWAVVHQPEDSRVTVGIVELDEGPWWWTELAGADPDADLRGVKVQVAFDKVGGGADDETQPYFRIID